MLRQIACLITALTRIPRNHRQTNVIYAGRLHSVHLEIDHLLESSQTLQKSMISKLAPNVSTVPRPSRQWTLQRAIYLRR